MEQPFPLMASVHHPCMPRSSCQGLRPADGIASALQENAATCDVVRWLHTRPHGKCTGEYDTGRGMCWLTWTRRPNSDARSSSITVLLLMM